MPSWKAVRTAIDQLLALVEEFKRGTREKRLALLAALAMFIGCVLAGPWLPAEIARRVHGMYVQWIFFGVGAALLLHLLVSLLRTASPAKRSSTKILPTAIKGAGSFGPHDGELFSQLGRGQEIATLLSHVLDDQVGFVVVMGESGAGKTSLLRSGLFHQLQLQQHALTRVYWEALPAAPLTGLAHAIAAQTKTPRKPKAAVEELEHWADRTASVVVLDQLEQLDPADLEHAPIFDLLSRLGRRPPPHRSTWIVAFRADFDPTWRYFELDHPHLRPVILGLKLFNPQTAKTIMATLAATVGFSVEETLLDDLFRAAGQRGLISPVDVGIGMLVLYELAERLHRTILRLDDYRFAGGAEGLLTAYLLDQLSRFSEAERGALLRTLLRFVDLPANRRIAEGVGLEELVSAGGLPDRRCQDLAATLVDARLLEEVAPRRYRLQHERLIEPLRRLTGNLLAARDQARIDLEEGFRRWLRSRQRRDLLRGRELRSAWRHRYQLGALGLEEQRYLKRSHDRRNLMLAALVLAAVLGNVGLFSLRHLEVAAMARQSLADWGLPGDLYDYQRQLKALSISHPMRNLHWLSGQIEDLTVTGDDLAEIGSLPPTVRRLHVTGKRIPPFVAPLPGLEELVLDAPAILPRADWVPRLRTLSARFDGGDLLTPVDRTQRVLAYPHLTDLTIVGPLNSPALHFLEEQTRFFGTLKSLSVAVDLGCEGEPPPPALRQQLPPPTETADLGSLRIRFGPCAGYQRFPSLPRSSSSSALKALTALTIIAPRTIDIERDRGGSARLQSLSLTGMISMLELKQLPVLPFMKYLDLEYAYVSDWGSIAKQPVLEAVTLSADKLPELAKLPETARRLRTLKVTGLD
ncbi:MAG TPA: ATP-binding protein, partial [Thermoanaerobaculia bacterium]|nr:ATP-binding protein [Thermoanaerobaculia bacterium]